MAMDRRGFLGALAVLPFIPKMLLEPLETPAAEAASSLLLPDPPDPPDLPWHPMCRCLLLTAEGDLVYG